MNIMTLSVCEGRHEFPTCVTGSVFTAEDITRAITNPKMLEHMAFRRLFDLAPAEKEWVEEEFGIGKFKDVIVEDVHLYLYVTGLTVATIAAINAARELNFKVTLMHYNRDTRDYFEQEVIM